MTQIHRFVEALREGTDPKCVARMASGWAVMGGTQVLPGYCLLLPDPVVPHLNALEGPAREAFCADMVTLGDAVLQVTGAVRINYEMLGNLEPALHAHVFPRFTTEVDELRTKPIWFYDWPNSPQWNEGEHGPLRDQIRETLLRLGASKP